MSSRVNASEDIPEMWSPNATHLFKSGARIPDHPPKTNIGGFYVDDNNHVTIYWKEMEAYEENGDKAGYKVDVLDGANRYACHIRSFTFPINIYDLFLFFCRTLKPDLMTEIMAQYRSLAANDESDFIFSVRSTNEIGSSIQKSIVRVPQKDKRCAQPDKIKKILATENSNMRKYMLSWSPPQVGAKDITSYTVFWCNTINESPNKCDVSVNLFFVLTFTVIYLFFLFIDVN